uniref:U19-Liphistoxin-Lth1a_1 n=2 Tax=Liphistius TaxID=62150 RepID=A0A4Q8K5L9_9ARAC
MLILNMNGILFIVILSIVCSVSDCTQCKYAKFTSQHSGCKAANSNCEITSQTTSNAEKNTILQLHNSMRKKVALGQETRGAQPKASDMKQLSWDDSLAEVAKKHAEQCKFEHDCKDCRRTDNYPYVGQNIFVEFSSGDLNKNWNKVVKAWYDEVEYFSNNGVKKFTSGSGPVTGHYTQLVWGNTEKIGCGAVKYKSTRPNMKSEILYVCNYGPGGNIINSPVYTIGEPGSKCPSGFVRSTEQRGLCRK